MRLSRHIGPWVFLAALGALLWYGTPAAAEPLCAAPDVVQQRLTEKWGEHVRARGLYGTHGAGVVELWVNPETASWTITVTDAARTRTCLVSAGTDWMGGVPVEKPEERI